jgi:hypothetical protein
MVSRPSRRRRRSRLRRFLQRRRRLRQRRHHHALGSAARRYALRSAPPRGGLRATVRRSPVTRSSSATRGPAVPAERGHLLAEDQRAPVPHRALRARQEGARAAGRPFFRQTDLLEDALHRIVQDVLEGFEKKRTASARSGCADRDPLRGLDRRRPHLPQAASSCASAPRAPTTKALEVFTLREEVRDWDRPLAEEHLEPALRAVTSRSSRAAPSGRTPSSRAPERKKIKASSRVQRRAACSTPKRSCARSSARARRGRGLVRHPLEEARTRTGASRWTSCRQPRHRRRSRASRRSLASRTRCRACASTTANERLLGFIVYVADQGRRSRRCRPRSKTHNHFHNVLVIYPDSTEPETRALAGRHDRFVVD